MKQETNKIRYFVYARKSSESEDRQVASIDAQIEELNKISEQNTLEIVKVFSESMSAKAPGRPIFNQMLERIHKGEADGILCWKLNRLARNPIDGGQISWLLQQGTIKHIQTFGRSYYPSDNVIVMAVELGMANQFIRDLSVDTKRGLRAKAERGWYPTYATLGYMHNPFKKKGEKEIINDPERYILVKKMFDLMLTGNYNPPQITKIANDEWGLRTRAGKKVAKSTVYRIFTDPFYCGEFEYPKDSGNLFKGGHEPMITKGEYDRIQQLLGRKSVQRSQTHSFAFTGLVRCGECGAMITAEDKIKHQKNGNSHQYCYYHCTKRKNPNCSQKTIEKKELEKQIVEILGQIEIPEEFYEWALEIIKDTNFKEAGNRNQIITSLQKQYNASVQKIDNLIDMRAQSLISEEEFANKKLEFGKEKMKFQELLNDSDLRVDDWLKNAEILFNFAHNAKRAFENGSLQAKREILATLGSNLTLKGRKLTVGLEKSFLLMQEVATEVKGIHKRLEPTKNRIDKREMGVLYAQSPMLLRG
jgi:site-specific DNA recombinase